jgi:hypothetical protein
MSPVAPADYPSHLSTMTSRADALLRDYVAELATTAHGQHVPPELDLILDVAGLNGFSTQGVLMYLRALERAQRTRVVRVSGASAGAFAGLLFLLRDAINIDLEQMFRTIGDSLRADATLRGFRRRVRTIVREQMRDEHLELVNGRLFVTYQDLERGQRVVASEYGSRAELLEALERSTHVPYVSDGALLRGGRFLDGLTPHFFTEGLRPAFFVSPMQVLMWPRALWARGESSVCARLLTGVADAHEFFSQGTSDFCSYVSAWSLLRRAYLHLREIVCLLLVALCAWLEDVAAATPASLRTHPLLVGCCSQVCSVFRTLVAAAGPARPRRRPSGANRRKRAKGNKGKSS